jgi:hypothetical protein
MHMSVKFKPKIFLSTSHYAALRGFVTLRYGSIAESLIYLRIRTHMQKLSNQLTSDRRGID